MAGAMGVLKTVHTQNGFPHRSTSADDDGDMMAREGGGGGQERARAEAQSFETPQNTEGQVIRGCTCKNVKALVMPEEEAGDKL